MKVSVLIPVWNGEKYIEDSIRSIMKQSHIDLEIVICDDGSQDRTYEILESLKMIEPRIILLKQEHTGKVAALNKAFSASSGDAICCFAHDDVMLEESVNIRTRMLEEGYEACYHDGWICDEDLHRIRRMYNNRPEIYEIHKDLRKILRQNPIGGGTIAFTRRIANHIFPIPDSLKFEDWWFTVVTILEAKRILFIPSQLILYRIHSANETGTFRLTTEILFNDWRRHPEVYDAFQRKILGYGRLTEEALKCIKSNKMLVMRTLIKKLTFPSISILKQAGFRKYIKSQIMVLGGIELFEKARTIARRITSHR